MRINIWHKYDKIVLQVIYVLFVMMQVAKRCSACGSYIEIAAGGSVTIGSAAQYGPYVNCIWWLETDGRYQLSININWVGDENFGRCGDYIVIQDSKDSSGILLDRSNNCTSLTNHVVTATASYMRVQFRSDGINYTSGFQGVVTSTLVGDSLLSNKDPIEDCRSYEWECSNKECMPISYRCDGFNDCGCNNDCDEDNCEGFVISKRDIMIIGACCGFVIFLIFFFFALAYELHLKRRTLMADPEAQAEMQRKKEARKRRAQYKKAAKERKGRR